MREQAAERELGNIIPILVKKDGLDEAYRADTFDLITIFHVLIDYEKEAGFLRHVGDSLADDGRLVLLLYKAFPDFSPDDFTEDHEGLAREIVDEPVGTPFYRAFRESTRESLRTAPDAATAAHRRGAIAEEFNLILAEANFGIAFVSGPAFKEELAFSREERDYADWLMIPNDAQRVSPSRPNATWVSPRNARMINKLLIVQKYRKHLRPERLYTAGLTAAGKDAFARAGYALHKEYADLIPFEDVLVYTRNQQR